MKQIILILLFSLQFCIDKNKQTEVNSNLENKGPEMLLLKLVWYAGDVNIQRNTSKIELSQEMELEKDDEISTGVNGSVELLLGQDNTLKMGNNTTISIRNLLTIERESATNILLKSGKLLSIIKDQIPENQVTIITPNALISINESISYTRILPKDSSEKEKSIACKDANCETKLFVLDGNNHLRQPGSSSDLLIEKNFKIQVVNGTELGQNMIFPLTKENTLEIQSMLAFHTDNPVLEDGFLTEYRVQVESKGKSEKSQSKITKKGNLSKKKTKSNKQIKINRKSPSSQNSHRESLKLDSNNGF